MAKFRFRDSLRKVDLQLVSGKLIQARGAQMRYEVVVENLFIADRCREFAVRFNV